MNSNTEKGDVDQEAERDVRTETGYRVTETNVEHTSHAKTVSVGWWTADGKQQMSAQFRLDGDTATIRDDDEAKQMINVVTDLKDVPVNVIEAVEESEGVKVEE